MTVNGNVKFHKVDFYIYNCNENVAYSLHDEYKALCAVRTTVTRLKPAERCIDWRSRPTFERKMRETQTSRSQKFKTLISKRSIK